MAVSKDSSILFEFSRGFWRMAWEYTDMSSMVES